MIAKLLVALALALAARAAAGAEAGAARDQAVATKLLGLNTAIHGAISGGGLPPELH
jgi:hypothetical protein